MKEGILMIGIAVVCLSMVLFGVTKGMNSNEIAECHQWQEQAAQFSGFYLVQWQADQCAAHKITINAPVK